MTQREIIKKLEEAAETEGLTRTQLAIRLGISAGSYYHVRSGERPLGKRIINGILREFPQLREAVFQYQVSAAAA